jgi:hypothetical protein
MARSSCPYGFWPEGDSSWSEILSLKIPDLPDGCEDPRRMILISRIEWINRWHMHWIKLVSDKDFHPCILIPIARMDQTSCHHLNPLNSGSMSSSPISYSTVSAIRSNPPYCWNTHGLALQYWVHHELLYSVKWLSLWKHTYTTFMIYFIGPVRTADVKKITVLLVCQYMHLCTNNAIHLLFEA